MHRRTSELAGQLIVKCLVSRFAPRPGKRSRPVSDRLDAIQDRDFASLALVFVLYGFPHRGSEALAFELGEPPHGLIGRWVSDMECHPASASRSVKTSV